MTPVRNESDQRVVDSLHKATYSSAEPKVIFVFILVFILVFIPIFYSCYSCLFGFLTSSLPLSFAFPIFIRFVL